jgi:FKBP-type peptidyl-prolyl cis-trans isomerase FkpA
VGTGQLASGGKKIVVGYKGVLKVPPPAGACRCLFTSMLQNGFKEFDRSANFSFRLGVGEVIKGWDEGCKGMREGGVRRLLVPSHLGYGRQGAGKDIPPNSDLVFEVTMKRVL